VILYLAAPAARQYKAYHVRRCAFKGRRECAVFSETGSGRPPLYFNNPYSRKKGQKYLGVLI
jgi:hypothetical protein